MTFKEFSGWCNERACDGCWDMSTAICCIEICRKINALQFWKRNKEWNRLKDYVEKEIVQVIEKKIELSKAGKQKMSWWTDGEPFDEYDPPYCKGCESLSCENCEYEEGEQE